MDKGKNEFNNLREQLTNYAWIHNTYKINKKITSKIGVAWVVKEPGYNFSDPTGWEVEIIDTHTGTSERCHKLINWLNNPPPSLYDNLLICGDLSDIKVYQNSKLYDTSIIPNEFEAFEKISCNCRGRYFKNATTSFDMIDIAKTNNLRVTAKASYYMMSPGDNILNKIKKDFDNYVIDGETPSTLTSINNANKTPVNGLTEQSSNKHKTNNFSAEYDLDTTGDFSDSDIKTHEHVNTKNDAVNNIDVNKSHARNRKLSANGGIKLSDNKNITRNLLTNYDVEATGQFFDHDVNADKDDSMKRDVSATNINDIDKSQRKNRNDVIKPSANKKRTSNFSADYDLETTGDFSDSDIKTNENENTKNDTAVTNIDNVNKNHARTRKLSANGIKQSDNKNKTKNITTNYDVETTGQFVDHDVNVDEDENMKHDISATNTNNIDRSQRKKRNNVIKPSANKKRTSNFSANYDLEATGAFSESDIKTNKHENTKDDTAVTNIHNVNKNHTRKRKLPASGEIKQSDNKNKAKNISTNYDIETTGQFVDHDVDEDESIKRDVSVTNINDIDKSHWEKRNGVIKPSDKKRASNFSADNSIETSRNFAHDIHLDENETIKHDAAVNTPKVINKKKNVDDSTTISQATYLESLSNVKHNIHKGEASNKATGKHTRNYRSCRIKNNETDDMTNINFVPSDYEFQD